MKLKDLAETINSRLKKNSLAHARLKEGFLDDEVIVEHPDPTDYETGGIITITKSFGWWYLSYEKDGDILVYSEVKSNDNIDDIHEIVHFINFS